MFATAIIFTLSALNVFILLAFAAIEGVTVMAVIWSVITTTARGCFLSFGSNRCQTVFTANVFISAWEYQRQGSRQLPDIYVLVAQGKDGGALSDHLSAPPINKKDTLAAVLRAF